VVALLMLALVPGSARAACVSSSPIFNSFADSTVDAQLNAPEILSVDASLDGGCRLTIDTKLQAALGPNQSLSIFLGFDPTTGDPSTETIDREVLMAPILPAPILLDESGNPIAALLGGQAIFSATLDELGVPAPAPYGLGIFAVAGYDDFSVVGDETYDEAPAITDLMFRLPLRFTQPPPPPPPPPPPAPPPAAPAAPAAKQATGCVVPKLKGLTVKKAKAALKKAGCKYKIKGKGRVRSFSPKAGKRTSATVQVKCKKKKRKKQARRAALTRAAQLH
jgi:hypothetical protein